MKVFQEPFARMDAHTSFYTGSKVQEKWRINTGDLIILNPDSFAWFFWILLSTSTT